ncbi:MAG: serine/threonine protein kinase, partial [Stenotrophomonas maltophilia]
MTDDRWQQLRTMFDAACELPPTQWRTELGRMTNDPTLLDEVIELLEAQTLALDSAQRPLRELIAQLAEPELQVGERIGPWRLTRRVASGGMGAVFLAERADETYQQRVAIKLLRGLASTEISQRLAAERQMLAGLEHPNIARLYDGGSTASGQPYLVMEYVDGEPLDRACRDRQLDLPQRLQLFVRICRTVQAAHARLVVHCD